MRGSAPGSPGGEKDRRKRAHLRSARSAVHLPGCRDIASNLTISSYIVTATDHLGRASVTTYHDGTTETQVYADNCCSSSLESSTDQEGLTSNYYRYNADLITETTRQGITTRTTHDASGRTLKIERIGTDNSVILQEETLYDLAGRVLQTKDSLGNLTLCLVRSPWQCCSFAFATGGDCL